MAEQRQTNLRYVILKGPGGSGTPEYLHQTVVHIGRSDSAIKDIPDLNFDLDGAVSHKHALLWQEDGRYFVKDTSTNGCTLVDGQEVKNGQMEFAPGVPVRTGETVWTIIPVDWLFVRVNDLIIYAHCAGVISYALCQCNWQLIGELTVRNTGNTVSAPFSLELEVADHSEICIIKVPGLAPDGSALLEPPPIKFHESMLREQLEVQRKQLHVAVDNRPVPDASSYISILGYRHWFYDRSACKSVAVLVSPNNPIVDSIILGAEHCLRDMTEADSFPDLLRTGREDTELLILKALYNHLAKNRYISYIPPQLQSMSDTGRKYQTVRLPHHIFPSYASASNLRSGNPRGNGTCLDLALLMAGCLERIGLYPLVIFTGDEDDNPVHALVACWVGFHGNRPTLDTERLLTEVRSNNMLLVECTGVTMPDNKEKLDFEQGMKAAELRLYGAKWVCGIDIAALRPPNGMVKSISGESTLYETETSLRLSDEEKRWFEGIVPPPGLIHTGRENHLREQVQDSRYLIIYGTTGVGKTYQVHALSEHIEGFFLKLKRFEVELADTIADLLVGLMERASYTGRNLFLMVDETYHGMRFSGHDIKAWLASSILHMVTANCKIILVIRTKTYKEILDEGLLPENAATIEVNGLPPDALDRFAHENGIAEWLAEYNQIFENIRFNPYALSLLSKLPMAEVPLAEIAESHRQEVVLSVIYLLYRQQDEREQEVIGSIVALDEYLGVVPDSLVESLWKEWGYPPREYRNTLKGMIDKGLVTYQENLILGRVLELEHDLLYEALKENNDAISHHHPMIAELYRGLVDETYTTLKDISDKGAILSFEVYRYLFHAYYLYVTKEGIGILGGFQRVPEAVGRYLSTSHPKAEEAYHIVQEIFHLLLEETLKLGSQGGSLFQDLICVTQSIMMYLDSKGEAYTKVGYWYALGWIADMVGMESRHCYGSAGAILEQLSEEASVDGDDEMARRFAWNSGFQYWRGQVFDRAAINYKKVLHLLAPEDIDTLAETARLIADCHEKTFRTKKEDAQPHCDKAIEYYIRAADLILETCSISIQALKLYKKAMDLMGQDDSHKEEILEKVKDRQEEIGSRLHGNIPCAIVTNEFDERFADKIAFYLVDVNPGLSPGFISPDKIEDIHEVIDSHPITIIVGGMLAPMTGTHISKLVLEFSLWEVIGKARNFYPKRPKQKPVYGSWYKETDGHLVVIVAGDGWKTTGMAGEELMNDVAFRRAIMKFSDPLYSGGTTC